MGSRLADILWGPQKERPGSALKMNACIHLEHTSRPHQPGRRLRPRHRPRDSSIRPALPPPRMSLCTRMDLRHRWAALPPRGRGPRLRPLSRYRARPSARLRKLMNLIISVGTLSPAQFKTVRIKYSRPSDTINLDSKRLQELSYGLFVLQGVWC